MYKNKIIFYTAIIVLSFTAVLCVIKNNELSMIKNENFDLLNRKDMMDKISKDISSCDLDIRKAKQQYFSKIKDIKQMIRELSDASQIRNVLFKKKRTENDCFWVDEIALKFSAKKERHIYDFIEQQRTSQNGFAILDHISIEKNEKSDFDVKIKYRLFFLKECKESQDIFFHPSNVSDEFSTRSLRLFSFLKEPAKYSLYCVINKIKAFINNTWMSIDDENEDFKLKNIHDSSIDIEMDGMISRIKIGGTW